MKDQIVLVTGAASGIGRAIAEDAAGLGAARLILLDLDRDGLRVVASELAPACVDTYPVDITQHQALEAVFASIREQHGRLDTVFNSAGIQAGQPAWPDATPQQIDLVIRVNLIGLMYVTHFAIPLMKQRGGSILNLASVSGLRAYLSGAIYGPSKAAVIHFTKCNESLAESHGIRVNALCPGMVNTPFLSKTGTDGKIAPWLQEKLDTGEVLSPRDVAQAAIRLAEDAGKAGQCEVLDAPPPGNQTASAGNGS